MSTCHGNDGEIQSKILSLSEFAVGEVKG